MDEDEILSDRPVAVAGEVIKEGEILPDGHGVGRGGIVMPIGSWKKGHLPPGRVTNAPEANAVRAKGKKPITRALRDALDENDGEKAKKLVNAIIDRACNDVAFLDRLWDRLEGKLVDKMAAQVLDLDEVKAEQDPDGTFRVLVNRLRARALGTGGTKTV